MGRAQRGPKAPCRLKSRLSRRLSKAPEPDGRCPCLSAAPQRAQPGGEGHRGGLLAFHFPLSSLHFLPFPLALPSPFSRLFLSFF